MDMLKSIRSKLSEFRELWIVLLIACTLHIISIFFIYGYNELWRIVEGPDITMKLVMKIDDFLQTATFLIFLLSLFVTPFAIYFPLTNDSLTLPIRLLAAVENAIKLFYAIVYIILNFCGIFGPMLLKKRFQCSMDFNLFMSNVDWTVTTHYNLFDCAQFCQMMISMSRFFAVSFDGQYFRYTLKWPFIQPFIPFALRIAIDKIGGLVFNWRAYHQATPSDLPINYYIMKTSGKVSRAERLLMVQMLSYTLLTLMNTTLSWSIGFFLNLFFGQWIDYSFSQINLFTKQFFFYLVTCLVSAVFLKKPFEKKNNVKMV